MIVFENNKWVYKDDESGLVIREALLSERPVVESTINSPGRIKARYEDSLRKTNILKEVCADLFKSESSSFSAGQLDELEEEKILIGLQKSMAVLINEVQYIKGWLTTPKPSFWSKLCRLLGF